ncbi:hypothetical protein OPV22_024734 [Ensete ventricosum]|uniref:Large ribosomal subunit protein mL54 n=1 Tax=Ensete ventricosum TaxID=4639 RepID=A0AAV8Q5I4_ENSVE|nr:hypothetical protein OPV22_024734 [Ensete ventricosum]
MSVDSFIYSPFLAHHNRKIDRKETIIAMSCTRLSRGISITNKAAQLVGVRGFAIASGKGKKGPKGGTSDAPKASSLSLEYPDWLWHLLDKRPTLSELRRKDSESLPFEDLKRFVKLDNRARIKENNAAKAKN